MVEALVFITLKPSADAKAVVDNIKLCAGVQKVRLIYGEYDAFASVEVADMATLKDAVFCIAKTKGVQKTTTVIVVS